jgi:general secretion pathway protein H
MKQNKGFTLIELLIVLVIIGIVVGAISLSLVHRNHSGFSVKASVNLLRSKILFAEQQAIVLNQVIGLGFSKQGYAFFNHVGSGDKAYWEPISQSVLKKQTWPLGMSLTLQLTAFPLPEELPADFDTMPQILINPSGDISPTFSLYINNQYTLAGTTSNDIIITAK